MKVSTETMIDLGTYEIKYLNTGKMTPEKSFTNAYIDEIYELEQVRTSTKQLHTNLYAKNTEENLNKAMENQYQHWRK